MRAATTPLLLGLLLLAAAVPAATAQAEGQGEETTSSIGLVSQHPALGYKIDVWQDEIAWASAGEETVELRIANLTSGEGSVATEIADPEGDLRISSLAYDGRWLVWSDNRFGVAQLFAFDTRNETLSRLTETEETADGTDVSDGFAVWIESRHVWLANAATGEAETYREQTAAVTPRIVGSEVLWARIHGTNTTLHLDDLDRGTVEDLVTVTDGGIAASALSANRVAWVASHLEIEDGEVQNVQDFTVETLALDEAGTPGDVRVVDEAGKIGEVAANDDWVAWKLSFEGQAGPVKVLHVPSDRLVSVQRAAMGGLSASSSYVAFVGADEATDPGNRTGGYVYAIGLDDHPAASSSDRPAATWALVAGGAALVGLGLSWGRLRQFIDR